jgi:hypothetical protein
VKVRTWWSIGAAGAVALVASACVPSFESGATPTFSATGSLVQVSWPAATESDVDQEVASYELRVDGGAVISVPAPSTSCVLTGLDASTSYTVTVTARDTAGEWSGSIGGTVADLGTLTATYETGPGVDDASPIDCVSPVDTDGDRLPDAVETNDGTFVGAGQTGTDPAVGDTDEDGISDGDEVLGTVAGLDLPAMGTSPTKSTILLEFDWFDDANDPGTCAAHSHRPSDAAIAKVVTAFADAPTTNPDGTTGVQLIADYGQGGAFTGGTVVADADGVIAGGVSGADFLGIKAANFAANRNGYFHYVLQPHRYNTNSNSSGQAEIQGDDLIVSLYCYGSDQNTANTIVHELGHNLNLRHGGNTDTNYKPNYNSVMNYEYQFPGVDTNCTVPGDGLLNFSTGSRATLTESALVETDGICSGVDIDWNSNGIIDASPIVRDINQDGLSNGVHSDHDDWGSLYYLGITDGDGDSLEPVEVITEQPVPLSAQD